MLLLELQTFLTTCTVLVIQWRSQLEVLSLSFYLNCSWSCTPLQHTFLTVFKHVKNLQCKFDFFFHSSLAPFIHSVFRIQKQLYERDGTVWQPLQFISDVKTRWNSTFLMIQRFLKLEVAVRLVTVAREKLTPLMDEDWSVMKLLEQMLLPFFEFTELVSGDTYATLSLLYPAVRAVLHHFRQLKPKITVHTLTLLQLFVHSIVL